jgi:beta-lactamase regulating signal transducer with metallopeptidase domain
MITPEALERIARPVVEALLNDLWQGVALTMLVWVALQMMRGTNAATRYGIWLATLLAVVLLPLITGLSFNGVPAGGSPDAGVRRSAVVAAELQAAPSPRADRSWRRGESYAVPEVRAGGSDHGVQQEDVSGVAQLRPARTVSPVQLQFGQWAAAIFAGWLLAACVMSGRIVAGFCALRRLKRRGAPLGPGYQARLARLLALRPIRRAVSLRRSRDISLPVVAGLKNATILLPERLLSDLTGDECDHIVLHELAHIGRWDDWTRLAQRLAEAIFFFHPAVWWIGRRMNLEREIACDDWVVAATGARRSYAACLAKLVELNTGEQEVMLAPGIAAPGRQISRRIEMLFDKKRNTMPHLSRGCFVAGLWFLTIGVVCCARVSPVVAIERTDQRVLAIVARSEAGDRLAGGEIAAPVEGAMRLVAADRSQAEKPGRLMPEETEQRIRAAEERLDRDLAEQQRVIDESTRAVERQNLEMARQSLAIAEKTRALADQWRMMAEQERAAASLLAQRLAQAAQGPRSDEPKQREMAELMRQSIESKQREIEQSLRAAAELQRRLGEESTRRNHEKLAREIIGQTQREIEQLMRDTIAPQQREIERLMRDEIEPTVRELEKQWQQCQKEMGPRLRELEKALRELEKEKSDLKSQEKEQ